MYRPPEFYRPPPCPVFEPTEDQFEDPLKYISSIRAEGEKYGIVKIRPPPSFQPPFALNVEEFKFRPRRQKINELSACTRIRTNFLEKLSKFWELQGIVLRIPRVENEILCLYTLHTSVQKLGGFSQCCIEKKWGELASRLGYCSKAGAGSALRTHYEKLLYPFDVFTQHLKPETEHACRRTMSSKASIIRAARRTIRKIKPEVPASNPEEKIKVTEKTIKGNKELAKLQLFGPGPKMQGLGILPDNLNEEVEYGVRRSRRVTEPIKPCPVKKKSDFGLKCVKCRKTYLFGNIVPKLFEIPKGDWNCPSCMKLFSSSFAETEEYGFESSDNEYTLREFGERADEFKRDYFNLPPFDVDTDVVEREFWRICDDLEEEVTVEYGADIQALNHGSGFSSRFNPPSSIDDPIYRKHPWNLVNLPVASKSVLQYIEGDISGVKVPWLYVGMCFSAFAWHTEDHWTYSINYHHWGEPKIWYGAPKSEAVKLEQVFKQEAGDLFEKQRDLMHHITTTISPSVLQRENVQICRAVQNAGEFIITFPRGYHAGFNSGLNLAEAVNFCPPDWFPIGREALSNYRRVHRYNIFSQDELTIRVAKLATSGCFIESSILTAAHADISQMIIREREEQDTLFKLTNCKVKKCSIKEDIYCGVCQTSVYCSYCIYVGESLNPFNIKRYDIHDGFVDQGIRRPNPHLICNLCAIERLNFEDIKMNEVAFYVNCEIESLCELRDNMKSNTKDFTQWIQNLKELKSLKEATVLSYQKLLSQGSKYEITREYQALRQKIEEAKKLEHLISEIFEEKTRPCLSMEDFDNICDKVKTLPFNLDNQHLLIQEHKKVHSILDEIQEQDMSNETCQALVEREKTLKVDINDMSVIQDLQKVLDYLPKMRTQHASIDKAQKILEMGDDLVAMDFNKNILAEFKQFEADVDISRRYEAKASQLLEAVTEGDVELDKILDFEDNTKRVCSKIYLKHCDQLRTEILMTNEWKDDYQNLVKSNQNQSHLEPSLHQAKLLFKRADSLKLLNLSDEVQDVKTKVQKAESWIAKLTKVFLKRNQSNWSLSEVLLPRTNEMINISYKELKENKKKRKRPEDESDGKFDEKRMTGEEISKMEERELVLIKSLKENNQIKLDNPDSKYCICQRTAKSNMYRCELCHEWIHTLCMPRRSNLCVRCLRSRRPALSCVIPLLVELQEQKLHIVEGDSLQALIERVVRWQSDYKMLLQKLRTKHDQHDHSLKNVELQLLEETSSLYVESLLLEVNLEESNHLKEEIKQRWPYINELKLPVGAELLDGKPCGAKDKRKRETKDKIDSPAFSRSTRPKRPRQVINKVHESSDSEVDDDGPCAVSNCGHPDGVDWICCDKCSRWFHCACVGLSFKEARAEKDFACFQCQIFSNNSP